MNGVRRRPGPGPRTRRLAGLARGKQRGQTLLELAVFLPLILIFGLACIQFAIIFTAYMNVIQVTRDATRWVAVHPHVIDSTTESAIRSRLPAGVSSGALTFAFSPACTALSSGKCTARTSGAQISVTSTYNITSHLFLPSSLGWGTLTVAIPTTLPAYTIFMQVEPS
jgi:hypothetical protein